MNPSKEQIRASTTARTVAAPRPRLTKDGLKLRLIAKLICLIKGHDTDGLNCAWNCCWRCGKSIKKDLNELLNR